MKMKQICCYALFGAALAAGTLTLSAQMDQGSSTMPNAQMNETQQRQGQPASARAAVQPGTQDSNATPGATGQEMKDKMFLRKAAQGGIAEVKLGQLAADKASSQEVKDFGRKMVADHTELSNEMKPIADSNGVRLPKEMNKMDQAQYDKLSALSGEDFDREYVTGMVKDHRKDLHEFREEAATTNDPALKAAVEKGESVIREHSRMINKIAREKGYMPESSKQSASAGPVQ